MEDFQPKQFQLQIAPKFYFIFQKYIFLDNDTDYNNPVTLSLIYNQLQLWALKGKLGNISDEQAINLAAMYVQHEYGDYNANKSINLAIEENPAKFLPELNMQKLKPDQKGKKEKVSLPKLQSCIEKITVSWQHLIGKSTQQIEKLFIEKVKELPFYGSAIFHVHYSAKAKGAKSPHILALNHKNLSLHSLDATFEHKFIKAIKVDEIASYVAKGLTLTITSGNLLNPTIDVLQSDQTAAIIKCLKTQEEAAVAEELKVRNQTAAVGRRYFL